MTDLARAKSFYGGVLGLVELERPAFDFPGAWYALGERELHLTVYEEAKTLRGTPRVDARDAHFALRVADFDATLARLRSHEVEVIESRVNPTPWLQMYVADPDGNVIELNADRAS